MTNVFSTDPEQNKALNASINEGMCHAAMLGAGETYLNAFAVFLRASSIQIGALAATPQLIGGLFQLGAVWMQDRIISRKAFLIRTIKAQAAVWILIALLPHIFNRDNTTAWLLLGLVSLYYACQGLWLPIWSGLIGDIIPADNRGRFFGKRSSRVSLITFLSIVLAGYTLHFFENIGWPAIGFSATFLLAAAARYSSTPWLKQHLDPPFIASETDRFTLIDFLRRLPQSNFARFVFFFCLMNLSVWFSAPFFAVYMLNELQMSYLNFTILTAAAIVTQILTLQRWGRLTDYFGNKIILSVCAIGISLVPLLWLFSSNLIYLIFIQFIAGFTWAGYNLACSNFLFDAVSPPKRGRCVAYQSLLNGCFIMVGSLTAGYFIKHIETPIPFYLIFDVPNTPLLTVIFISGCLRLLTAGKFLSTFKEVREIKGVKKRQIVFEILHVRAMSGLTFRPLWPSRNKPDAVEF